MNTMKTECLQKGSCPLNVSMWWPSRVYWTHKETLLFMDILHTLERKKIVDLLIGMMTIAMVITSIFLEYQNGYVAGTRSVLVIQQPQTISISGKITDITGTTITVQETIPTSITGSTKQVTIVQIVTDEMTIFNRAVPSSGGVLPSASNTKTQVTGADGINTPAEYTLPPVTFETTSLAELKVDDTVALSAMKNFPTENQFTATRVIVIEPVSP